MVQIEWASKDMFYNEHRCWQIPWLYDAAKNETGVKADWSTVILPRLMSGEVVVAFIGNEPVGFLQFQKGTQPTGETCWAEHMLYVLPPYRGKAYDVAPKLLQEYERAARAAKVDALLAGSSLHHNEQARRRYEEAGFKTNYTFKKELHYV